MSMVFFVNINEWNEQIHFRHNTHTFDSLDFSSSTCDFLIHSLTLTKTKNILAAYPTHLRSHKFYQLDLAMDSYGWQRRRCIVLPYHDLLPVCWVWCACQDVVHVILSRRPALFVQRCLFHVCLWSIMNYVSGLTFWFLC